ncbi:ATP-dependent DNA helicase RecG [Clostridium sp. JN-9]|uniref:ATP-dependent DNA helicase RecG n=1 Tax=Clostridium sp. JN-9 TaxID=2507159 RepID=UPI000FFE109A|nr:ATP-dependent DNA helicase RecG [Clostridium sp. JN-9]QAT40157.1 ATP-dependent DNA helicase RecG [Clostridium sp. JN-9]
MDVYSDISTLKGVGPKTLNMLNKCLIFTVMDLILYFPRDYDIITNYKNNEENASGKVIVKGIIENIRGNIRTRTGKNLTNAELNTGGSIIELKWFNQPYIKKYIKVNDEYLFEGKIQNYKGRLCMANPKLIKDSENEAENNTFSKVVPKYPLTNNLKNSTVIKLVNEVLSQIYIEENLPQNIILKYNFCSLDDAIKNIHNPKDEYKLKEAVRRLKFQELFTYSLKILMLKKYRQKNKSGNIYSISKDLTRFKELLPYSLTNAQNRCIREILLDQKSNKIMNRLVQGDVGSGKTIVAIISMLNVVKNGYQVAMMAPTEILANQHLEETKKLLDNFNVNIEILSGSQSKKEKNKIKENVKLGIIDILIGTHALLEDDVEFKNLGLIVTDEQHRFGVSQRSKLINKGSNADILVMSATPIPRTLSLYLYGDLDISVIDELPPGRQKIDTYYISEHSKDRAYRFAVQQLKEGRQIYIVCPLVEENEDLKLNSVKKLYEQLKEKYFKNFNIKILHGRMTSKEKDLIMEEFKKGEISAIISTTVIEVGINVPNATVMIIENAERFGLAQLHQLRGRVGRGNHKSYCILIADIKNDIIRKRMEIMKSSNDGFYISEQDFKIRGSGEIFGLRQHGDNGLILCSLPDDINILKAANEEAKKVINTESEEQKDFLRCIMKKIEHSSKYICFN